MLVSERKEKSNISRACGSEFLSNCSTNVNTNQCAAESRSQVMVEGELLF